MIDLECDACGQRARVKDAHAGKRGKCPNCSAPVRVPTPALAAVAAAPDDPLDDDPYAVPASFKAAGPPPAAPAPAAPAWVPVPTMNEAEKLADRARCSSSLFEAAVLERMDRGLGLLDKIASRVFWVLMILALPFFMLAIWILFWILELLGLVGVGLMSR